MALSDIVRRGMIGIAFIAGVAGPFDYQTHSPAYPSAYADGKKPDKELEALVDGLNPAQAEEWNKNKQYQKVIDTLRTPLERAREYELGMLDEERRKRLGYAMNEMGFALEKLEDRKTAISFYELAQKLDPLNPSFCYNAGVGYKALGNIPKAVEFLKRFTELKPDDPRSSKILDWIRKNS